MFWVVACDVRNASYLGRSLLMFRALLRAIEQRARSARHKQVGLAISWPPRFTGWVDLIRSEEFTEGRAVIANRSTKKSIWRTNTSLAPLA